MEKIKALIDQMVKQTELTYDRLPDIDLYMDQVIEYLARQRVSTRETDKISPAMINNYIKDGLLPRATEKKYSREHLAYLMMISRLKQTLSVKDTGRLLTADIGERDIVSYFNRFQELVARTAQDVGRSLPDGEKNLTGIALRLAVSGYVSRLLCELILEQLDAAEKTADPAEPAPEAKDRTTEN